ncbi:MAG: hypothetical protein KDC87_02370 [Planctomycetes bacterium]|nr:hypothetical protein [Planctomycetota bacterium]MCB9889491.1 hypothetical protein [Planctomycetota bacterium]
MLRPALTTLGLAVLAACSHSGSNPVALAPEPGPASLLNRAVPAPASSFSLADPQLDALVVLVDPASGTIARIVGGSRLSVQPRVDTGAERVLGLGIRFGDSGPIRVLPMAVNAGTLPLQIPIPDDICGGVAAQCHEVRCYLWAVTHEHRVSRPVIQAVALACASCGEPSCRELLPECHGGDLELGTLVWAGLQDGLTQDGLAMALPATRCASGDTLWLVGADGAQLLILQVPLAVAPGTYPLGASCQLDASLQVGTWLAFGVHVDHPEDGSGSITISEHSATQIRGSFTFQGRNEFGPETPRVTGHFFLPKRTTGQ